MSNFWKLFIGCQVCYWAGFLAAGIRYRSGFFSGAIEGSRSKKDYVGAGIFLCRQCKAALGVFNQSCECSKAVESKPPSGEG